MMGGPGRQEVPAWDASDDDRQERRKARDGGRREAQVEGVYPIGWMCCFLLLVGLSLRAGSQQPSMGQYLEGLGYRVIRTKPVRWWGGSRVNGRLEGKRVEFYCFPGAAYSLVDPSLTNRLKRLGELGVTLSGSYLGDLAGDNALVAEHLALGDTEFYNQPLRVGRPSPELRDRGVRVILGNDFLLRYHAVVELGSGRLYLRSEALPASAAEGLAASLRASGYAEVGLGLPVVPWFTCRGEVEGLPMTLLLDFGGGLSVLDNRLRPGLRLGPEKDALAKPGATQKEVFEFESLRLGDVPVSPFSAVVTSLKQMRPMVAQVDERVDGTLAAQALVRHAGVLDCGQRKLWLIRRTR